MVQPESATTSKGGIFANIPSKVKWLIISFSFSNLAVGYLIVLVTAYLPQIGFSSGFVGLLVGVFGIVPVLVGIPLGILSDRRGRKWLLIFGTFGISPGLILFSSFASAGLSATPYFIAGTIILGLGEASALTSWNAIIADQTTPENRDSAFSLSFIVSSVGIGIGSAVPLAFPKIESLLSVDSRTLHFDFILIFSAIGFITPILIGILLRGYVERIQPKKKVSVEKTIEATAKRRTSMRFLLKFSGINSLIGFGAGFIIPLIPTWLYLKFQILDTYSGPLFALSNITIAFAAVASPRLSKRYGIVNAIVMTEGFSTIFMLSLAFVTNAYLASSLYIVRASLMNMAAPLADSFLMGELSAEERGLASAVNSIIWRLPNSASTIIGGLILQEGNYGLPFFLAAGFYAASIALFYTNFRRIRPQGKLFSNR